MQVRRRFRFLDTHGYAVGNQLCLIDMEKNGIQEQ
jgi:hypothetical protein